MEILLPVRNQLRPSSLRSASTQALRRRTLDRKLTEDMRMPAHHFVRYGLRHIGEVERAFFFGHTRMEHHLEEEVAKFFLKGRHVVAFDGVGDLIGFFDGIGRDAGKVLHLIPRTATIGIAQARHDGEQALEALASIGLLR